LIDGAQVGFARVVSDRATFAFLCDVFVLSAWRGRGLARRMLNVAFAHQDLQGLRRFALTSRDAGTLYAGYGFTALARPQVWMERHNPAVYVQEKSA
jgi:GNAT superfamily N-acetyltransferase